MYLSLKLDQGMKHIKWKVETVIYESTPSAKYSYKAEIWKYKCQISTRVNICVFYFVYIIIDGWEFEG